MTFSTKAGLKAEIVAWSMNKTNLPTDSFVTLAEARINKEVRQRATRTDAALVGVIGARTIALPAGFLEPIDLFINIALSGRTPLRFINASMDTTLAAGSPEVWSVDGVNVVFDRPCDAAYSYTLTHMAGVSLAADGDSNWLLANYPDVYLSACMVAAGMYEKDDAQITRWEAAYVTAKTAANDKEFRSRAKTTLRADPALVGGPRFNIQTG